MAALSSRRPGRVNCPVSRALGRSAIANPDWPTRAADPTWTPVMPPVPQEVLLDGAVSPGFVEYLRAFNGFVAP
ncbi:MAG: hypothetical protein IV100_01565 [Myxococcales bacterium]|nr:hypothetical protein [Myxococcales bacterium]